MILLHCESFGYNIEPTIERLSPDWARFKASSTYYSNAVTPATSTLMTLCGVLSGQYPAYSFHRILTDSYLADMRSLGGVWLQNLFPYTVAIVPSSLMLAQTIDFDRQLSGNPYEELKNAIEDTPRPRLILVYVPYWKIHLGLLNEGATVEEAYLFHNTDIQKEGRIFGILPDDEIVVAFGDHGNTWRDPQQGHTTNTEWDTIRAPIAIFNPSQPESVVDKLFSHLDLCTVFADLLDIGWGFPTYAYEHGKSNRKYAYTRTCFTMQGRFTPKKLWEYPPLLSVTDGVKQAIITLPITTHVTKELTDTKTAYFQNGNSCSPTNKHKEMEQALLEGEQLYRRKGISFLYDEKEDI